MKKELFGSVILLLTTVVYLSLVLIQNKGLYLKKYDHKESKKLYEQSQWQQSQNFSESVELEKWSTAKGYTGWNNYVDENKDKTDIAKVKDKIISDLKKKGISDAQLYAYAGYEYFHGTDPTLLNPEHPPLGKYIIGLSILIFNNEHVGLAVAGLFILSFLFLMVYLATASLAASSLAVFLTATHSLFIDQLINGPQLDIFQLLFLIPLIIFLYFHTAKRSYIYLIAAGICFGLLISVKTFLSYYFVFNIWIFFHTLMLKKSLLSRVKDFAVINLLGLAVFTATYLPFFQNGGDLKKFLGVQKYIFMFYRQSGINPLPYIGNYLRLIFTGTWKFWSQGSPVSSYDQWTVLWIFTFLAGLFVCYKFISRKHATRNPIVHNLLVFSLVYNLFLFIFPVFPRYLLLLFVPYHALISIYFLSQAKK